MHSGQMRTMQWLILRLWKCSDTMPFFLCEQLAMESGSTYTQGVRSMRPLLNASTILLVGTSRCRRVPS